MANIPKPNPDSVVRALNNRLTKELSKAKAKGKSGIGKKTLDEICDVYVRGLKDNTAKIKDPQKALILGSKLKALEPRTHGHAIDEIQSELRKIPTVLDGTKPPTKVTRAAKEAAIRQSLRDIPPPSSSRGQGRGPASR